MIIITSRTPISTIKNDHNHFFTTMVKGVADVNQGIIALDAEMHADLEEKLLANGSAQQDLWGFNILFDTPLENALEYTSLINIRPNQNNSSMEVLDPALKDRIKAITWELVDHAA